MEQKKDRKIVSKDVKTGKVGNRTHKPKNIKVRKKDFDKLLLSLTSVEIAKQK